MGRKVIKVEEPVEEPVEEIVPEPVVVEKKKKVLSQAQLDALARGRQRGVEKLKEKGNITRAKQSEIKQIKQIKEEEKINDVEELKEVNNLHYIRKTVEHLNNKINVLDEVNNKFSHYLTDRETRKKMKDQNVIQKTVKSEIPRVVNEVMLNERVSRELSRNPFLGCV